MGIIKDVFEDWAKGDDDAQENQPSGGGVWRSAWNEWKAGDGEKAPLAKKHDQPSDQQSIRSWWYGEDSEQAKSDKPDFWTALFRLAIVKKAIEVEEGEGMSWVDRVQKRIFSALSTPSRLLGNNDELLQPTEDHVQGVLLPIITAHEALRGLSNKENEIDQRTTKMVAALYEGTIDHVSPEPSLEEKRIAQLLATHRLINTDDEIAAELLHYVRQSARDAAIKSVDASQTGLFSDLEKKYKELIARYDDPHEWFILDPFTSTVLFEQHEKKAVKDEFWAVTATEILVRRVSGSGDNNQDDMTHIPLSMLSLPGEMSDQERQIIMTVNYPDTSDAVRGAGGRFLGRFADDAVANVGGFVRFEFTGSNEVVSIYVRNPQATIRLFGQLAKAARVTARTLSQLEENVFADKADPEQLIRPNIVMNLVGGVSRSAPRPTQREQQLFQALKDAQQKKHDLVAEAQSIDEGRKGSILSTRQQEIKREFSLNNRVIDRINRILGNEETTKPTPLLTSPQEHSLELLESLLRQQHELPADQRNDDLIRSLREEINKHKY